jgi:hypothetical protein
MSLLRRESYTRLQEVSIPLDEGYDHLYFVLGFKLRGNRTLLNTPPFATVSVS